MCGRFVSASPPADVARYFSVDVIGDLGDGHGAGADPVGGADEPRANYNVAPTTDILVVYEEDGARRLDGFRWGLVPGWAKDLSIGNRMINARAETIAQKSAFKRSFEHRRCIIPADGFYEWKAEPGVKRKQPYYISRPDGEPYAFGGLWAQWRGEVGGEQVTVRSTTIITSPPNEKMAELHDRMPLILPAGAWAEWLDPELHDLDRLSRFLVPAPPELIEFHKVTTAVNNVRHNGPELLDEVAADDPGLPFG